MLTAKEASLLAALEPAACEHGVEIVTVEIAGGSKAPRICVYVDTPEGVDFDTLQSSTQWIGDLMDEIDPFPGAYQLEVSSPGIDRPLRTVQHFAAHIGETVVIRAQGKIDGRSVYTGTLEAADEEKIKLLVDGREVHIPFNMMKRANVKGVIDFSKKD